MLTGVVDVMHPPPDFSNFLDCQQRFDFVPTENKNYRSEFYVQSAICVIYLKNLFYAFHSKIVLMKNTWQSRSQLLRLWVFTLQFSIKIRDFVELKFAIFWLRMLYGRSFDAIFRHHFVSGKGAQAARTKSTFS